MSDHILKTIEELEGKLSRDLAAIETSKLLINQLCTLAGIAPRYDLSVAVEAANFNMELRSDQFYGQPLAACVREILSMRKSQNKGPASVNEIYQSLVKGGFAFDTKNDDNAKRGLRVSITKNTALFHKLPSGEIGLLEWYPNAKAARNRRAHGVQNVSPAVSGEVGSDGDDDNADIFN